MHASLTCVRALLTQGKDAQATQLAQQVCMQSIAGQAASVSRFQVPVMAVSISQAAHQHKVCNSANIMHAIQAGVNLALPRCSVRTDSSYVYMMFSS